LTSSISSTCFTDAEVLRSCRGSHQHVAHQLRALRRDCLPYRAFTELGDHRILDDLTETIVGEQQAAARRGIETHRVDDSPLHEKVDFERLFLSREYAVRAVFDRQDTARKLPNILHHGDFDVQTGLVTGLNDFAELQLDGEVALVDGKQR
jgi:hypothetical protein